MKFYSGTLVTNGDILISYRRAFFRLMATTKALSLSGKSVTLTKLPVLMVMADAPVDDKENPE